MPQIGGSRGSQGLSALRARDEAGHREAKIDSSARFAGGAGCRHRIPRLRRCLRSEDPEEAKDYPRYEREMKQDIERQKSIHRRGLPEEQAAAIAFLASEDASFITGQVIDCSGGQG